MSTTKWPVVALDAGHGLNTPGKRTPDGIHEWELNDKVRDYTVEYLEDYEVKFIFPDKNEGKTDESLTSRRTMYISADADVCVSLHHNAFKGTWGNATGVEVYADKNCTAADKELASLIMTRLAKNTGLKNRGVKFENWAVINTNEVTAVLVEGGFMDSKKDYKVITSTKGQKAYAKAVADALIIFLDLKKKNKSATTTTSKTYKVKFKEDMNVRKSAGTNHAIVDKCKKNYVYTIKKTKKVKGVLWGYLKSGAGWVCIDSKYCSKV